MTTPPPQRNKRRRSRAPSPRTGRRPTSAAGVSKAVTPPEAKVPVQPDHPQLEPSPAVSAEVPTEPESKTTATDSPPPPVYSLGNGLWQAQYEAVVGLAHRDMSLPLPCQDAALARNQPRPMLMVADGAGSSAASEWGSQCVVTGIARLLDTLEQHLVDLLDSAEEPEANAGRSFGLLLVKHARGLLVDLAYTQRRSLKDVRCTLLVAVVGQQRLLWIKLGDGALVYERIPQPLAVDTQAAEMSLQPQLMIVGTSGKGEFANQTQFIDEQLQPQDVQVGLLPVQNITGIAAMSDGAADRLVAHDGVKVAAQLSQWFEALRHGALKRRALTQRFYSEPFTQGTTGDDCSVALLATGLNFSPPQDSG